MGRASDKLRSSRRPGLRERARVKKQSRRGYRKMVLRGFVGGAGTYSISAGRKKFRKVRRYVEAILEEHRILSRESTPKSERIIKRPLYTIVLAPSIKNAWDLQNSLLQ